MAELVEGEVQEGGHELEIPPRVRRAFLVHYQVLQVPAVVERDDLAMLPAHVDDSVDRGVT